MLVLDPVKWFNLALFCVELEQQELEETRKPEIALPQAETKQAAQPCG